MWNVLLVAMDRNQLLIRIHHVFFPVRCVLQVETFFLEALEEVKRRIVNGRQAQYRRAVSEYNKRVRESSRNRTKFPKIRYLVYTCGVGGDSSARLVGTLRKSGAIAKGTDSYSSTPCEEVCLAFLLEYCGGPV